MEQQTNNKVKDTGKRPPKNYRVLYSQSIKTEKKLIYVDVIENKRGRALRITEICNEMRNSVIIPAEIIEDYDGYHTGALQALTSKP